MHYFHRLIVVASLALYFAASVIGIPLQLDEEILLLDNELNTRVQFDGVKTNRNEVGEINQRPIIGVLAQECQPYFAEALCNTSYIAASYVKYVESGGARVVPVFIDQPEEYYRTIFHSINGLLIPGGDVSLNTGSGYSRSAKILFRMAIDSGEYFPIWGTCMGLEVLTYLSNEENDPLTRCDSNDQKANLFLTEDYPKSRFGISSPDDVDLILSEQNVTINFHNWCLTPENFTKLELLKDFWNVLSTNYDENGIQFISMMESKHYPIWAVQYHPEKNMFEWTEKYPNIPHTQDAVHIAAFHSEFFVEEARKNLNTFPSREEEEKHLIYNYSPVYTGTIELKQSMIQCYFF